MPIQKRYVSDAESGEGDGGGVRTKGDRETEQTGGFQVRTGDSTERGERKKCFSLNAEEKSHKSQILVLLYYFMPIAFKEQFK